MRTLILLLISLASAGCAVPQYRNRLVAYPGTTPNMPARQVADICNAQSRVAYAQARSAAQAQLDARNNQVTGYNCATYGQASSYGNYASYSGNTNCAPVTANPYGGKYGVVAAIGDAAGVEAQAMDAERNVLAACAARYGYSLQRYCAANCGSR